MRQTLAIAGYLAGAVVLSANVDGPASASSMRKVVPHAFAYTPAAASTPHEAPRTVSGPVVEMTTFHVEEMRPQHAGELEENWAQHERLRPKALIMKSSGAVQVVAFEMPYLYEAPTPPSSNKVGGVMLTVPVVSLRW